LGFRAGTALPFFQYDAEAGRALDLLEIPLVVMDGHVMAKGQEDAVREVLDVAAVVKEVGGVLVLDWHTESYCNQWRFEGYRDTLEKVLKRLLGDDSVWVATPTEVQSWWRARSQYQG